MSAALGSYAVEPTTVFTVRIGDYGDQGMALAVDAQGNSYVAGSRYTATNPFPISNNAAQTRPAAMFIAKVDARGERIVWATYLGGSRNRNWYWRGPLDTPSAITADSEGNVYVVGNTAANDFPVENAALGVAQPTGSEGFLTKISADGSRFIYSTYLGGYVTGIATDVAGYAYVAINARDQRLPFERRDLSQPGIIGAIVVAKFNPLGQPVFATRFGTPDTTVTAVAADATGSVIVTGSTPDRGFPLVRPISTSCWRTQFGQCTSPYVSKLDPSGTQFVYSTLLGGSTASTTIRSMAVDPRGSTYVLGTTTASDYPVLNAYQPTPGGGEDYVLSKISATGVLETSTYIGSDLNESSIGLVPRLIVDVNGRVTLVGGTASLTGVAADMQHRDAALWRSDDNGQTWSASSTGLRTSAWAFAVSEPDSTWYVGAADGVYRSVDGGRTWSRGATVVPETYAVAVDSAHPGTVYAGTRGGLYKSQDRGVTWTAIASDTFLGGPYHPASHAALVVDGNGTVFVGTDGIRRSSDGGRTWIDASNGFQRGPTGHYGNVGPIVFDPNNAGTIYALQSHRAYRSRDGGSTWTQLNAAFPPGNPYGVRDFYGLGLPPGRPGRLYASGWTEVLRSDDEGGGWITLADRRLLRARFLFHPVRPETIFAFDSWAGEPLLVSHDGGDSWTQATVPTPRQRVFAVDPLQPGVLFAPSEIRTLAFLLSFDSSVRRVVYSSFLDFDSPSAVATDAAGNIYLLRSVDGRTLLLKLAVP